MKDTFVRGLVKTGNRFQTIRSLINQKKGIADFNYPYRNLVFKGGGIRGIAYAGALEVLE
jgi:predicted acylesterase/phospholipase RssA